MCPPLGSAGPPQPRSTLATLTEIHDFLRLLYARAGTAHCPQCGRVVSQQSAQQIVTSALDELLASIPEVEALAERAVSAKAKRN